MEATAKLQKQIAIVRFEINISTQPRDNFKQVHTDMFP